MEMGDFRTGVDFAKLNERIDSEKFGELVGPRGLIGAGSKGNGDVKALKTLQN